jgi:TonB family protein
MKLAAVILLLASLPAFAQDIPDNANGFDQQFRPAIDALRSGDVTAASHAFATFALPPEWFQQTFGPASDALLQQQYKDEFDYFQYQETRRIKELSGIVVRYQFDIRTGPLRPSPPIKPAPASLQPLPAIEPVHVAAFREESGHEASAGSWENLFVYVNGAFRFFGTGRYPFWDPVRIGRPDMCDPSGHQPGGKLTNVVTPMYPDEARNNHVEGPVMLRVTVAPDGSVSSADRMSGDAQLAESAIAAAKQWKYQPFVNCGKPVEGQALERVKYSLSDPAGSVEVLKRSETVRISSGVAASNVVSKVIPQYPPEAKQAGIQGAVVLLIKIGKDGRPHDIQFVSGVPQLADAAIEAVKQWQYKPYLLNGQPTEVETTVQVNFTLNRR